MVSLGALIIVWWYLIAGTGWLMGALFGPFVWGIRKGMQQALSIVVGSLPVDKRGKWK